MRVAFVFGQISSLMKDSAKDKRILVSNSAFWYTFGQR